MRKNGGFTLLELMIVVAIIAILAIIAITSYQEQLRKSRRADAMRSVGQLQLDLERWRSENPCYGESGVGTCPTFTASGTYPSAPTSNFYTITPSGQSAAEYIVTAAPRAGTAQFGDKCGNLVATRSIENGKPLWATLSCR